MANNPELEAKIRAAAAGKAPTNPLQVRLQKCIETENSGDLEKAYLGYVGLYNDGFPPAAFFIGNMFMRKGFRAVEETLPDGRKIRKPDLVSALSWHKKAADRGVREAMCNAGIMMTLGQGCEKDREGAKKYLVRAKDAGSEEARAFLFQNYPEHRKEISYTDEEYGKYLTDFISASAQAKQDECHKLFFKLTCGNDEQLSSFGTVLALHKYSIQNPFVNKMPVPAFPKLSNGMPCAPIYPAKRVKGATTIHLNTRCFPGEKIKLTLCTSVEDLSIFPLQGIDDVEELGVLTYEATPFGTLPKQRYARVIEFTPSEGSDTLIFTENGDEKYFVEIGWIDENEVLHFMLRYSIDLNAPDIPTTPTVVAFEKYESEEVRETDETDADSSADAVDSSSEDVSEKTDAHKTDVGKENGGFFKNLFKKN